MSEAEAKPINMQRNRLLVTLCSEEPANERTHMRAIMALAPRAASVAFSFARASLRCCTDPRAWCRR